MIVIPLIRSRKVHVSVEGFVAITIGRGWVHRYQSMDGIEALCFSSDHILQRLSIRKSDKQLPARIGMIEKGLALLCDEVPFILTYLQWKDRLRCS